MLFCVAFIMMLGNMRFLVWRIRNKKTTERRADVAVLFGRAEHFAAIGLFRTENICAHADGD